MEVIEVDPANVTISDLNERQNVESIDDLVKNVKKNGVIQPPLARKTNGAAVAEYAVVVGQRRLLAAQEANLGSIPLIVVEWDDADAMLASVTENVDRFREKVAKKDRALTIERLKELKGWTNQDVAEEFGVAKRTVSSWLEYTKDEWKGTSLHADNDENEGETNLTNIPVDDVADKSVETARRLTGGGEEGEAVVQKFQESGIRETKDIAEVRQKVEARTPEGQTASVETVEEAIEEVADTKKQNQDNGIRVYVDVTFSGQSGSALKTAAENEGASERDIVRKAITQYLETEGYL